MENSKKESKDGWKDGRKEGSKGESKVFGSFDEERSYDWWKRGWVVVDVVESTFSALSSRPVLAG